jgi:hypothetical protein
MKMHLARLLGIKHLLDTGIRFSIAPPPGGSRWGIDPREGVRVDEDRESGTRLLELHDSEERLERVRGGAGLALSARGIGIGPPHDLAIECSGDYQEKCKI